MKNSLQRQIKHYIREISLLIPNDYPNKKLLLAALKQNLDDFSAEHPNSSFEDMIKEFGMSSEITSALIDELPGTDIASLLQKKERHNHFIFLVCISFTAFVFLTLLGCMYYYWWHIPEVTMGDTYYYYNGSEVDYEEFMELQTE